MIRVVRRKRAVLPKLYLPDSLLRNIGQIIEGNIIDNIARQQKASGLPLKRNKPATVRRKRSLGQVYGGAILSLVAMLKRFVRPGGGSWKTTIVRAKGPPVIMVSPATAELANISRHVQNKGYVGWFGISKKGATAIRATIQEWIKAQFRKPNA